MKRSLLAPLGLALLAYLILPLPGFSAPLSQRIDKTRSKLAQTEQREGVLTSTVERFTTRIARLEGELTDTRARLDRAQASLDRKQAELLEVRDRLQAARDRLERLHRELQTARRVLAARLVEIYKSDMPDALTVVLESDGFGDLLERAEYFRRIAEQDREITDRVRGLRDRARDQADELARLEAREQFAAERILRERDQIAAAQDELISSRDQLASARAAKRGTLADVRRQRGVLENDLASLEAEQARIRATLAAAPAPGPIQQGSGTLIWPLSGTVTGSFGEARPGHMHAGLDIAVPEGTPIRAADSGRVALAAWTGGYGNYTCVQHTASLSTCYAHQSRLGTSSGASVKRGQVIGYSGNTGNSTGPHLHFEARLNGAPVDPMGYL